MNQYLNRYIKGIDKLISITLILIYLISCSEKNNKNQKSEAGVKLIDEFNIVFPHLNLDYSWEPNLESIPNEEFFLQLVKNDSVSKFNNIWIHKTFVESEGISDGSSTVCYSISNIYYYWFDGIRGRMIVYNDRLDTLWEYIHLGEITDLNQEIFIQGKYQYQYSNLLLKPNQRRYFEMHSDSLRRIKGNELPELPEVERN